MFGIGFLGMSAEIYQFCAVSDAPNRIRELRMAAKLSQQKVADRIGASKVTISDLENGKMALTQDYMRRIALALDCAPSDLLPFTDNPDGLSLDERRLIEQYRSANDSQRDQIQKMADVIAPFRHDPGSRTAA